MTAGSLLARLGRWARAIVRYWLDLRNLPPRQNRIGLDGVVRERMFWPPVPAAPADLMPAPPCRVVDQLGMVEPRWCDGCQATGPAYVITREDVDHPAAPAHFPVGTVCCLKCSLVLELPAGMIVKAGTRDGALDQYLRMAEKDQPPAWPCYWDAPEPWKRARSPKTACAQHGGSPWDCPLPLEMVISLMCRHCGHRHATADHPKPLEVVADDGRTHWDGCAAEHAGCANNTETRRGDAE